MIHLILWQEQKRTSNLFHRNRYENMSSDVITIIYALSYLIDLL